jgi:hypothetical protein
MSWSITRPNTTLRVTKFAPETEPLFAGLTPEAREAHRAKRAAECAKVEPWTYEVRAACNAFMYGSFVEVVDTTIHPSDCTCVICVPEPEKKRPPYDSLYLKQKADPWK